MQYTQKEWNACSMCSTLKKNETPVLYAVHSKRMKHLFDMQYTHKE